MAAFRGEDAEGVWMPREPFEHWLAQHASDGGRADEPGTVLV
jgi:hypothetical protein